MITLTATPGCFTPANIPTILSTGRWAILSAENPGGKKFPDEVNLSYTCMLAELLTIYGYRSELVKGRYAGNDERSFLVYGIDEQDALRFAQYLNQESILTPRGLVDSKGNCTPATGVTVLDSAVEDNFTYIPRTGVYFRVDIDFDA